MIEQTTTPAPDALTAMSDDDLLQQLVGCALTVGNTPLSLSTTPFWELRDELKRRLARPAAPVSAETPMQTADMLANVISGNRLRPESETRQAIAAEIRAMKVESLMEIFMDARWSRGNWPPSIRPALAAVVETIAARLEGGA